MPRFPTLSLPLWIAAAVCWSIPFLVAPHTYPIPTFYGEFVTAVCWIVLGVSVLGLTWASKTGLPSIALAPLALIVVLLVQLAVATPLNPFFSFAAIVFLFGAAVVCGLGARCRGMPGVLDAIAVGILIGGLLTVAIECLQLFRVPGLPSAWVAMMPAGTGRRMWGNLNQPNHVASYLAFGLAACLLLAQKYRRSRVPLVMAALVFLLGMALTFSRVTWLHLCVVGGIAGLVWSADVRGARRWWLACVPLVALAVAYQVCNWLVDYANVLWHLDLPSSLGDRFKDEGNNLRLLLWKHAWHMFLAHPWLGGGWGDYAWNQYVQTDTLGNVEMSLNAHNIVLDLLAKVGTIGLLAVALPFVWLLYGAWRRPLTPELAFLATIILVMGVHSMLEYPLHYLFFLLPFAFALGYADERELRMPSGSMVSLLTGVVVVGTVVLTARMWVDYKSVERLYYIPDGARQATYQRYQASGQLLLVPYGTLAIANSAAITYGVAPIMSALEREAVHFYPGSGTVQRYALALALQGKTDEAVTQVRRLHHQYWTNYATQSTDLTGACAQRADALEAFCARLRSERLLIVADPSVNKN
ncbi:PglL family O-oligosaccharyltransferase [Ralstonia sp. UBA689]|uniref:PglL family O-oligosaccharyltransferase n=1 Tax=Ralstonia sp. UBA689 TaxID=1947373 RepID=UPI0025F70FDE|nr:Wzy polymerase domain-containing protein [Ralstonia sp. UBA689]